MKMKKLVTLTLAVVTAASVALTGCGKGIDEDAVVATLGDKEISLGLANFMAQRTALTYNDYYVTVAEGKVREMWQQDMTGTGVTLEDTVKNAILEQLHVSYLFEQYMEDYDVEITEAELAEIDKTADAFIADNTKEALDKMGAKKEYVVEMLRLALIQQKMQDAIYATVDTEVTDEEAAQKTISYFRVSDQGYYDDEENYVKYTDEEKAGVEDIAKKAAENAKEDFDAAAEDYTVREYSYGDDELDKDGKATGNMKADVIKAANKLEEGEVSDPVFIEGDGYYIIRLDKEFDKEATEEKKEEIVKKRQSEEYTKVRDEYKKEVEWVVNEDVWATVDFDDIFTTKKVDTEEGTESVSGTEE